MFRRYLTKADTFLIVVLTVISLAAMLGMRGFALNGAHVTIESSDGGIVELSLAENREYAVNGPMGDTVVVIEDGAVFISDSPCPHHYCERMGKIRRRGEVIVCVPNRVIVSIKGGDSGEALDSVTQ